MAAEDKEAEFETTVTFEEVAGKTRVTLRAVFPTAAIRDFVLREVETPSRAGSGPLGRLDAYVAQLEVERGEFTLTRVYAASPAQVFAAWMKDEASGTLVGTASTRSGRVRGGRADGRTLPFLHARA